jgi:hypothetical protein
VAKEYHTQVWFSSKGGSKLSKLCTECAASTPKVVVAVSGPKRMPSQISRSKSLGWQNKVLWPLAAITSHALGSVKPVRY